MPTELPPEAGLLVTSSGGKRLFTKKKAISRDVDIPEDIFRYILMWRTSVIDEHRRPPGMREYWEEWLKKREIDHRFGDRASETNQSQLRGIWSEIRWDERNLFPLSQYDGNSLEVSSNIVEPLTDSHVYFLDLEYIANIDVEKSICGGGHLAPLMSYPLKFPY